MSSFIHAFLEAGHFFDDFILALCVCEREGELTSITAACDSLRVHGSIEDSQCGVVGSVVSERETIHTGHTPPSLLGSQVSRGHT